MNSIRVMLIDDHDISLLVAQHVISVSRLDITTFLQPSGFSALAYLEENCSKVENLPTIIFLDLDMPVIDGVKFLEGYLKFRNLLAVVPSVYILSSFNEKTKFLEFIRNGVINDYLIKPLTYDVFQNLVAKQPQRT